MAAERIADLCCKMWFNGISVDLPSATRWYSFLPHLARQCGAMMCHQLLARVLTKAYGNDLDPAANQAEEGSFHVTAHQRKTTSLDFVNNQPASAQAVGVALLCSQPIEDLSYRLQSVDHTGGSIIELTDTGHRPLDQCSAFFLGYRQLMARRRRQGQVLRVVPLAYGRFRG